MGGAERLRQVLFASLAALGLASPAIADPAIWKVSDADSSIHLFGSVHVFTRELNWRTPQFDALLAAADYVTFELVMDLDAYATVSEMGITKGRLPGGQTLADLLSADDYERFRTIVTGAGMDPAALDRLQPWLAAMTLMSPGGVDMRAGVELTIEPTLPAERKRGLETAAQQMAFLADAPLDEQLASLRSTLDAMEAGIDFAFEPLVDAWLRGDADTLARLVEEQMSAGDDPVYDRLITQRNENWIAPLEQMLADNDDSLVIVGAAHLVGDNGVPAILAAKGYRVERVDAPAFDTRSGPLAGALGRAITRR